MPKKKLLISTLAFICIICLLPITSSAAKNINLEKGMTYKLKIKKGNTVKLSNKKVLMINKKYVVVKIKTSEISEDLAVGKKAAVVLFKYRAESMDNYVLFEGTAMSESIK